MNRLEYKISYRRNLPHAQPPGATLFVTFRLVDSISTAVQLQLIEEAERIAQQIERICAGGQRNQILYQEQKRIFAKWDAYLDSTQEGPHWLRDPDVAQLVSDALHYRDGRVYNLDAFCVMSKSRSCDLHVIGKRGWQLSFPRLNYALTQNIYSVEGK